MLDTDRCPCLSGMPYGECCGVFHRGGEAPTAVQLMRSRYTAFVVGDAAYLRRTWHPSTRPARLDLDGEMRWFRLDIVRSERGGPLDTEGLVEFRAHYRRDGVAGQQHEVSRFVRAQKRWRYLGEA